MRTKPLTLPLPLLLLLLLLVLGLALACGGETKDPLEASGVDAETTELSDTDPDGPGGSDTVSDHTNWSEIEASAPLPLVTECTSCHAMAPLRSASDPEGLVPKDWLFGMSEGLERNDPAIPDGHVHMALVWPRRGHHGAGGDCGMCHPLDDQGVGHGLRVYPSPDKAFEAGTSCATACHPWLPEDASAEGFEGAQGTRPSWSGSLRPKDLLEGVETAHTKLWREGARVDGERFRITGFNPGCGGCHNPQAEAHGTLTTCTGCHRFGDQNDDLHQDHVALIAYEMDEKDVDAAAEDLAICAYCHAEPDSPLERHKASCYNCHLSGHRPSVVFWSP
jgi:hypothetical protein